MTAKHTPGPWITNGNQIEAKSRLHTIIATTTSKDMSGVAYAAETGDEAAANARLIAAAPDILEALKRCAAQLSQARTKKLNFDLELAIATAGSAVAKAEGRS